MSFKYEFNPELPLSKLREKLALFNLNQSLIEKSKFSYKLSADAASSNSKSQKETLLLAKYEIYQFLFNWPPKVLIREFSGLCTELTRLWINAYGLGLTIAEVNAMVLSLHLSNTPWGDYSRQIQGFLTSILNEAVCDFEREQSVYIQNHDEYSGLPKTNFLFKKIKEDLEGVRSSDEVGVLLICLKAHRSFFGAGQQIDEKLLTDTIELLKQNILIPFEIFQTNTNEIAILLKNLDGYAKLQLLAIKLVRAFEHQLSANNELHKFTPIIAGATPFSDYQSPDLLYKQARMAMDTALQSAEQVVIFNDEVGAKVQFEAMIDDEIVDAFLQDQLQFHFQPIVQLADKKCVGAELLMRFVDKSGKYSSPARIMNVLYQRGLGRNFLRWLLNTSCRYLSELQQLSQVPIYLTVNLYSEDLLNHELPTLLAQIMSLWKIKPELLVLEIPENGMLVDEVVANQIMQELINTGCKLALDDFGTGYSSLARLRDMPIQLVKIDQSFIRNILNSPNDVQIVEAIIFLAHTMHKEVVVEGVEKLEILNLIQNMRADKVQGYYFSRPLVFADFVKWANELNSN